MGKSLALEGHVLAAKRRTMLPMTFAEIENSAGFTAPRIGSKYAAWWSNNPKQQPDDKSSGWRPVIETEAVEHRKRPSSSFDASESRRRHGYRRSSGAKHGERRPRASRNRLHEGTDQDRRRVRCPGPFSDEHGTRDTLAKIVCLKFRQGSSASERTSGLLARHLRACFSSRWESRMDADDSRCGSFGGSLRQGRLYLSPMSAWEIGNRRGQGADSACLWRRCDFVNSFRRADAGKAESL